MCFEERRVEVEGGRNGAIDWLRAAAVTLVMLYHGNLAYKSLGTLAGLGWIGVDLFFVLSGLLVSQSWIRRPQWPAYLKKRAWRVLPAYYATLLIGLVLVGLFAEKAPDLPRHYVKELGMSFVYLSNLMDELLLGPFWSLSVEVHFWLMLPFLVWGIHRFGKKHPGWVLTGLLALPILARGLAVYLHPEVVGGWQFPSDAHPSGAFGGHIYTNTFAHMDAFLVGVWISVQGDAAEPGRKTLGASLAVGASAILLSIPFKTYAPRPLPMVLFQFTGLAIGFGALAAWSWAKGRGVRAPRPVVWLSDRIYSLYLAQAVMYFVMTPLLVATRRTGAVGQAIILAMFIATTCLLGDQMYRWIESHFLHGLPGKKEPLAGEPGARPGNTQEVVVPRSRLTSAKSIL